MVCHSFRGGGCWVADQWPLQFLAGFPQHKDIAAHSSAGSRHGCRKSLGPENMHKDVATDLCIIDDEWYCNMSGNFIRLSWSAKWWSLSAPGWACESLLLNKSNRSILWSPYFSPRHNEMKKNPATNATGISGCGAVASGSLNTASWTLPTPAKIASYQRYFASHPEPRRRMIPRWLKDHS